ncbi:MAG: TonB-dependent receptor, partial [Myxococcota bacterium]|nr:TonB-dependent receptor [Myxococcota bacterium]
FFNDYKNLTGQCTLSGGCTGSSADRQYNGGQAWLYGAEAVAGDTLLLPTDGDLSFSLSYAWTRTQFRTSFYSEFPQFGDVVVGDSLPYVPEHQGGATVGWIHPTWEINLGATARSGMLDEAGSFPISQTDVPALLLLDAGARIHLKDQLYLYTTATNLTGATTITSWRPMGARPTAPFQVMVGLKLDPTE